MNTEKNNIKKIFHDVYETLNTLKYTLMLDTSPDKISALKGNPLCMEGHCYAPQLREPQIKNISAWIDSCFTITHDRCRYACENSGPFFNKTFNNNDNQLIQDDTSLLDYEISFWTSILKEESVLSAYHKSRILLSYAYHLNNTDFTKLTLPYGEDFNTLYSENRYGLYHLLSHRNAFNDALLQFGADSKLHYPEFTDKYINEQNRKWDIYELYRSKSTSLGQRANDMLNNYENCSYLSQLKPAFEFKADDRRKTDKSSHNFLLQLSTLEFFQYARSHKSGKNTVSLKHYTQAVMSDTVLTKKSLNQYIDDYKKVTEEFNDFTGSSHPSCHLTLADKVYTKYIFEKVFPFDTIDCMYENIMASKNSYFLKQNLDVVSKIMALPNSLSRHIILQMAIDNLNYDYNDVPAKGQLAPNIIGYKFSKTVNTYIHNINWLNSYIAMTNALSKFIFPVYDNFFFIMLWESTRKGCETDLECLHKLFFLLSRYLNDSDNINNLMPANSITQGKEIKFNSYKISSEAFINPFTNTEKEDTSTYHECIKTILTGLKSDFTVPAFLSKDYMLSLGERTDRSIQKLFYSRSL